jgi:hypothetical protein
VRTLWSSARRVCGSAPASELPRQISTCFSSNSAYTSSYCSLALAAAAAADSFAPVAMALVMALWLTLVCSFLYMMMKSRSPGRLAYAPTSI